MQEHVPSLQNCIQRNCPSVPPMFFKSLGITLQQLIHSVHWGINPLPLKKNHILLSCQASPPLNQQTVQAPPFLGNPPSILVFCDPHLKVRFSSDSPKY